MEKNTENGRKYTCLPYTAEQGILYGGCRLRGYSQSPDSLEENRQWLQLLSYSNSPLFVSCTDEIPEECKEDLRTAYKVFNREEPHEFEPLGIYEEKIPTKWKIDGEIVEYDWK